MKVSIFYFSGTGNTWFIAKALESEFETRGAEVAAVSIEEIAEIAEIEEIEEVKSYKALNQERLNAMIHTSDKIIIGYPIYGSMAPKPMIDFIKSLPDVKGKEVSVFTTLVLASGDGAIVYRNILEEKGYVFGTGLEFKLSNNFNVPEFPDVLPVGSEEKIDKRNEKALPRVRKMVDLVLSDKNKVQGDHKLGNMLGNLQRKHVEGLIRKINRNLYVESSACIHCNKCVKLCPVENITDVNNKIIINDKCVGCMRCYHFCPTKAINITEASLDTKKWPRYRGVTKDYVQILMKNRSK